MTTTTRNDAEKRLRSRIDGWAQREDLYEGAIRDLDAALAAERLATVERIRERMEAEYTVLYGRGVCLSLLSQVLDEEAARP